MHSLRQLIKDVYKRQVLQKLSDSDKELIKEKFFYEKSYSDIAKELFISKSVVIDRVDSALRKMIKTINSDRGR